MDDDLDPRRLARAGARLGHTVMVKPVTGSTNDDARALAEAGREHGLVVVAEEQERGRGRLGRAWHSPPGRNLLFSVILRQVPDNPGLVTIAAGVAACQGLATLCQLPARIKWPNDVQVRGRKLCGVLAEAGGAMDYIILGLGINVNLGLEEMPEEIRRIATSLLLETGSRWPREVVFKGVMEGLEECLLELERGGTKAVLERWQELSESVGRRVRAKTPGGVITGLAAGIRDDGALLVRQESGEERAVMAGDVKIINMDEHPNHPC